MHLAILMTNTDESDFAFRFALDGQKFTDLIHLARPDWRLTVFAVKDGVIPDDLSRFGGVIITGSPASTLSRAPWVAKLLGLIREMNDAGMPIFGVCFGHQAIALALGGQIGDNPDGWFHGLSVNTFVTRPNCMRDLPDPVRLYASHKEQVVALPEGAVVITKAEGCDVTGFAMGAHILTTQQHPEMTPAFMTALTEELADQLGADNLAIARATIGGPVDTQPFAEAMARFFEQAAG